MKIKNIHVILFILLIIVLYFSFYFYQRHLVSEAYKSINTDLYNWEVIEIYDRYPGLFNFSEDNECIITVEELLKGQDEYDFDLMHDSEGNQCIGYYIINKDLDNNIDIDSSHICDMIDY